MYLMVAGKLDRYLSYMLLNHTSFTVYMIDSCYSAPGSLCLIRGHAVQLWVDYKLVYFDKIDNASQSPKLTKLNRLYREDLLVADVHMNGSMFCCESFISYALI